MSDRQKLNWAHRGMALSLLAIILAVLTAYLWRSDQHLVLQGLAHFSMLLFAVILKVSYVLRLHALHRLGRPVN